MAKIETNYVCADAKICNTKECYHKLLHAHSDGCKGLCSSFGGHPTCVQIKVPKKEVTNNVN